MLPLATPEQLEGWLGRAVDYDRAQVVIDFASSVVRAAAGSQSSTWTTPETVPAVARTVTVQLAARMLTNPTGERSQSTGPFSRTFGDSALTDGEMAQLNSTRPTGGLRTLTTYRDLDPDSQYLAVSGSDKPIPF